MRESMIYNPCIYQLREKALHRMLEIIEQRKQATTNGLVLFGDSIFELYDVKKFISSDSIYNCGIGGASTDELLWFIDEAVIKYQPSKVILHVGTNDLGNTAMNSPRKIAMNIGIMTEIIHKNLPKCQIYIFSPLPCIESKQDYHHVNGIRCNRFIQDITFFLEEYVNYAQVVHVYDEFMNEDDVNEVLYSDGLHPNDLGYQIMTKKILEIMNL